MSLNIEMKKINHLLLTVLIVSEGTAVGQEKNQQDKIDALERQLIELKQQAEKPDFLNQAAAKGLQLNFYGQLTWASGGGTTKADAYRYVLVPTYKLSDSAKFVSEFELEHGGVKDGSADRFSGALELEQMYIDVNVNEYVNWRSLGVSLIPIGEINQYHEPDQFYSSFRPQIYTSIIPTTWMELGTGINGNTPIEGLSYEYYLSQGLNPDTGNAGKDNTAWTFKNARPDLNKKDIHSYAHSLKLAYDYGGLHTSASTYMTTNHNSDGEESDVQLYSLYGSYRFENGLELVAEKAWWNIDNPQNLTDAAQADITNDEFGGYRLEAAYHIPHGDNTITPFIRYEELDTAVDNSADTEYLTFGVMYKFGDNWEIKANVEKKETATGTETDTIQLSVGMQF